MQGFKVIMHLFNFHLLEIAYIEFFSHFSFSGLGASKIKLFGHSVYIR